MFKGTILLIDRFSSMNTLINSYLTASGYVVDCIRTLGELNSVRLNTIHLALLDIDTAGDRLSSVLGQMRSAGVPTIVLTSENDYSGRLTALELGENAIVKGAHGKKLVMTVDGVETPVEWGHSYYGKIVLSLAD